MKLRPWHAFLFCVVALASTPNWASAQETRLLEGGYFIEITDATQIDDYHLITFQGTGSADALGGDYVITDGQYRFYAQKQWLITEGFMVVSTKQGSIYCYFEGDAVFTGGLTGELYIWGGTGIYKNAVGNAHIDALFGRYGFTFGTALFVWYGEITY